MNELKLLWKGVCYITMGLGVAVLICIGPIGWILLFFGAISDARERRHKEVIAAIKEGRQ